MSLRSIFVHFTDLDNLLVAAGVRHIERIADVFEAVADDGPRDERIDAVVARRMRWYERVQNVRRAAELQEPFAPQVARMVGSARAAGRSEVERVFAIELNTLTALQRRDLLAALDAATSFGAWRELRLHQNLSETATGRAIKKVVVALLG